jgi:hypothetical protein
MSKLKEKSPAAMSELRLRKEAMQICSDVVACGALEAKRPWADRTRIMAHCVKVTLGDHQDVPSYEQLLALIDVQLNPFKDLMIGYLSSKSSWRRQWVEARIRAGVRRSVSWLWRLQRSALDVCFEGQELKAGHNEDRQMS